MPRLPLPLLGLLLLGACRSLQPAAAPEASPAAILLHINDVYEIAPLEKGTVGGMARVAALEQALLREDPDTYTLLAGDFLSPSVIGTVKIGEERVRGAQMVSVMNQAGVDLVCFGNHEFDLKAEELQKRLDESQFGWISGNVHRKTEAGQVPFLQRGQPLPRYQLYTVQDARGRSRRIGVITVCLDANQPGYVAYADPYASAAEDFAALQPQADAIVALTHLSIEEDRELARRLPGLALIMGGHEHEQHFERVGPVPIAKADANAKSAWVHRIAFTRQGQPAVTSEARRIDAQIPLEPRTDSLVKSWESRAYQAFLAQGFRLDEPVAQIAVPLDGLEAHVRTQPTNLGQALAEACFRSAGGADLALINSGSIRLDDYLQGEITQFDIIRALPFGGKVLGVDMKGSLLRQVLDIGLGANRGAGGYLQTHRVVRAGDTWVIGGAALDDKRVYRVAIGDFLMTGQEKNLGFLLPTHPDVLRVNEPAAGSIGSDVRKALIEVLKKG
ncbi:MAG: bifunctional metallophosphatase/5'-nucleotidase [Bacteroidia bacterium]|nr:bifunctional metallophosphatase/5'-nucleotidase [Bacteroidia bacterium]